MKIEKMTMPIYMDYSSTTPVDQRVADKMIPYITEDFGNPASRSHPYGWTADKAVESARKEVAKLVNADSREIVWTSGATESNNLAIKGAGNFYSAKGKHIITLATEHKAVIDAVREMERIGYEATFLTPEPNGLVDIEKFKAALRPDTVLVTIMFVNNEIGVIQDIEAIGNICRENKTIFHVDAAQATGKVEIDLEKLPVDLMSFSAHKTYGPKGVGFGKACERVSKNIVIFENKIRPIQEFFEDNLEKMGAIIFGRQSRRINNTTFFAFPKLDGVTLLTALDKKGFSVASGSACSSNNNEPSHVLLAMGIDLELAQGAIRFSMGVDSTLEDVEKFLYTLKNEVERLKQLTAMAV